MWTKSKQTAFRIAYSFIPETSNGDRFTIKQSLFTLGSAYCFGNEWFLGALGSNYSYGNVYLREEKDNVVPNLIEDFPDDFENYEIEKDGTLKLTDDDGTFNGSWEFDDKKENVTFSVDGYSETFKIIQLKSNEMILENEGKGKEYFSKKE